MKKIRNFIKSIPKKCISISAGFKKILNDVVRSKANFQKLQFLNASQTSHKTEFLIFHFLCSCYSSVGRVGGRQYLSLDTGCHDLGSILHETMHAIGEFLFHYKE